MIKTFPAKIWTERKAEPPAQVDLNAVAPELEEKRLWSLLEAIEAPRFLTADQAGALLYSDLDRATKAASGKLRKLWELGLSDSFRLQRDGQGSPGGSSSLVYCLTKPGAQLLAARRDVPISAINWNAQARYLHTMHVMHRLNTVDLHVALAHYCRQTNTQLMDFLYEPRFEVPATKGKPITLAPDALAEVDGLSLLVEIDRGTERPMRFIERCARYEAFYTTGVWRRWLRFEPMVLVVVTEGGEQRVSALRDATAEALKDKLMARWRFTAAEWLYGIKRRPGGRMAEVVTAFGRKVSFGLTDDEPVVLLEGGSTDERNQVDDPEAVRTG